MLMELVYSVSKKSLLQDYWLVRIALLLWVFSSAFTVFLLINVDRIVYHDLYGYGLQFNVTWGNDYWGVSRTIYACMIVPAVLSIGMLAYDLVRNMNSRKRNDRQVLEKSMPITCSKCKKRFSKAIVMLDFNQKPPKRVNVCPYCNTVLDSTKEKDSVTVHISEHQIISESHSESEHARFLISTPHETCRYRRFSEMVG